MECPCPLCPGHQEPVTRLQAADIDPAGLSATEAHILALLLPEGTWRPSAWLAEQVWGACGAAERHILRTRIRGTRRRLAVRGDWGIETAPGQGYRLVRGAGDAPIDPHVVRRVRDLCKRTDAQRKAALLDAAEPGSFVTTAAHRAHVGSRVAWRLMREDADFAAALRARLQPVELGRLEGPCRVQGCGLELKGHPRCAACSLLSGPSHVETSLDDRGHCQACAAWWQREQARRAVGVAS